MFKLKNLAVFLASAVILGTPFACMAQFESINADKNTINIIVDGERVVADNFLYNDTTYVPLRRISEMLAKNVEWKADENAAYITDTDKPEITTESPKNLEITPNTTLSVERNSITIYVNGEKVEGDNFVFEGTTYVPLRKISEMLKKDVSWDGLTDTATIGTKRASVFDGKVLGTINGRAYTDKLMSSYKNLYEKSEEYDKNADAEELIMDTIKRDFSLMDIALEIGVSAGVEFENAFSANRESMIYQLGNEENYNLLLQENGLNNEMYYYANLLNEIYAGVVQHPKSMPTDDEVKAYYEKNKELYAYDGVRAKHILIMAEGKDGAEPTDADWKAAEDTAKKVYELAKGGSDFDALIKEYNMDPGVAQNPDGYIFTKGEMVEPFEKKSFSMSVGEISEPVKTNYGYHIIRLEEKLPYYTLDMIKEEIQLTIAQERVDSQIEEKSNAAKVEKN